MLAKGKGSIYYHGTVPKKHIFSSFATGREMFEYSQLLGRCQAFGQTMVSLKHYLPENADSAQVKYYGTKDRWLGQRT
jgi:hypothetical protein